MCVYILWNGIVRILWLTFIGANTYLLGANSAFCLHMVAWEGFMLTNVRILIYFLGAYFVMSVVQGGCGFPFLAEPVFNYLVDGSMKGINVAVSDSTVRFIMVSTT